MRIDRVRSIRRAVAVATVAALATTGLAACGGDDDDAQSLALSFDQGGQLQAPSSAETGLAEITLRNDSDEHADAQLIYVEGNHSAEEVVQGLGAAGNGKPFPDWFFAGGGTPTVPPGRVETVTQVLKPGTYYVFNTNTSGQPDPETIPAIKVTGEETEDELPDEADAEVQAIDYGFEATGLTTGRNRILFANTGAQPHHIIASRIRGDATIEDVERAFRSDAGPPPIVDRGTQTTAVVEGGESQLVNLDLKPGRYALYCFISDRQGGPPHAIKGMVDEVEVPQSG
jgi:hypothetical protein